MTWTTSHIGKPNRGAGSLVRLCHLEVASSQLAFFKAISY